MSSTIKMSESQIKERIAESGKTRTSEIISYFKYRFENKFELKLLRQCIKETEFSH